MTGDEVVAWLASIFPGVSLTLIDATPVAHATHNGRPLAVTAGFSSVDSGLVTDDGAATSVRCEIVCTADTSLDVLGSAVVATARELERLAVPAQPGVLLEGVLEGIGAPEETTVRHAYLREPQLFAQGTPMYTEPGQLTLLLELVGLTDDEFAVGSEQGAAVLDRRLRRRGVDLADWARS
ncbi:MULTISPECIES: suppressor of fused domain protein [unclassified Corynebacterium]|uniref:suppressor of fused domain protein n=1 Tax=unclassified Corynebacterium TaxID=2624378 RepID=UPI002A9174A7|nr:suppressor of fused domain protein [Corynebacterium sp.]MDY5785259.1 suppressor of fused domain protein [Corynebacterium sp.]